MKRLLPFLATLIGLNALAQSPVVKIDINMSGRTEAEVNDPDYKPWVPEGSTSSITQNGVTFTLSRPGGVVGDLRPDYYKVGVQSPNFARLVCDAVKIDGGDAGAQIQLEISGLATGTHNLLTFHNGLSSSATAPLDIYVNSTRVVNDLAMPMRALTTATAATSYLTFNATAGQKVTIKFQAETTSSAPIKNVYLCGFELNTPNFLKQAKDPFPVDKDEHVDISNKATTLKWAAASGITKHRVYFGTDEACVANGTTSSSCYKGEVSATSFAVSNLTNLNKYFWRIDEVSSSGEVTKGNLWFFRPAHLAFPGAEGYGRMAVGGRGGKVVHVTNLKDDNNQGSFRYAVENETGPRTIVFDVGGVIVLNGRLTQSDRFVTVAGQTAPGQGICFRKAPVGFTGYDCITRFMRTQVGYGITYDGFGMTGSDYSIMDHCSINFAIDEQFSSRGANNITLQKTFIAEALNVADHDKKPKGAAHGYAGTISGGTGSYHHNLLVHNEGRNFSMGDAIDGSSVFDSKLDLFNNVCYNFCGRTNDGQVHKANFVNNFYKKGPASKINKLFSMDLENYGTGTLQAYYSGNIFQNQNGSIICDGTNNSCGNVYTLSNGNPEPTWDIFPKSGPFFPSYATIHSAKDAYKVVLSDAGANQPYQTPREIRLINETKNGTTTYTGSVSGLKGLPDREGDAGGYDNFPTTNRASNWDTDKDGLPDVWEKMIGTSPNSSANDFSDSNEDPDGDGYTNLEDYLNWLAEPHYFLNEGGSQTIELKDMFMGFGSSATFAVSDVKGGKVTISGTKATYTPSGCGFGSFVIKATESGFTMPRNVGVMTTGSGTCSVITDLNDETLAEENTLAFPNPFSERLTVQQKGMFFYQIFGLDGIELGTGQAENNVEIGQSLNPGVYMLKIQSEGQSRTKKIVKAGR